MNKQFLNGLLFGAVVLSTGTFTSCSNDDVDDLKSRVSVIEVAIDDLKSQLSKALMTGASITNVAENNGTYTLTLSDGQSIVIKPGGGAISIDINDTNAIITIEGVEYVLPLGSSINSLVYSPETVDGIIELGNQAVVVKFLARPALTADDIAKAKFDIAEAHQVTRGAYDDLFVVKGQKVEGDFVEITMAGADALQADKDYAVALQVTLGGTVISSNYFIVHISADFTGSVENLLPDLTFASEVTDAEKLENGAYVATLPAGKADFLDTFNFKDLLNLPEGDYEFALGKKDEQNGNVLGRYEFFKGCLASDGTWTMTARPGTNCSAKEDEAGKDGLQIIVKEGNEIKAKVYWKIIDPLAKVDFRGNLAGMYGQHLEYGEPTDDGSEGEGIILAPGVNSIDLNSIFTEGKFSLMHGNGKAFVEAFQQYAIEDANGDVILYNDGSKVVVDPDAKTKYAKFSRGLNWFNIQTSVASSQRRGIALPETDAEKIEQFGGTCNGEIIGGWDGISGDDMRELGLSITGDGLFTTNDKYGGWALRVGMGFEFEYDYGMKSISEGCLAYIWINRRKSAEGVTDLSPR